MDTGAFGTTAPDWSVIVPTRVAVTACPSALWEGAPIEATNKSRNVHSIRFVTTNISSKLHSLHLPETSQIVAGARNLGSGKTSVQLPYPSLHHATYQAQASTSFVSFLRTHPEGISLAAALV
jgi:hypothetical protein